MKPRMFRKRMLSAVGGLAVAAALTSACMPTNNQPDTIAVAGSDTTEDVMAAIVAWYNTNPMGGAPGIERPWNGDPDDLDNVLSVEDTPNLVNGDANCGTVTYHTPAGPGEVVAPNGSSNGRNALKTSVNNGDGCIDIARSSGPPRAIGSDLATFEYYAYALDALGWASASTKAPANMTLNQLRGVYNCTFTNWSQVGGTAGPIERYMPQTGSGTYQFFKDDVLGFDPVGFSGPSCPALQYTQENSGEAIADNNDEETALVGYSMANWVAQSRGTAPDQRFGQTMHDLNGQNLIVFPGGIATPNTAGPVNESNVKLNNPVPAYPGIRYVFNVIDKTHVTYKDAKHYVGFQNRAPDLPEWGCDGDTPSSNCRLPEASPLCDGSLAGTIENFGFGPLDTTISSRNLLGSTCRLYTP